MKKSGHSGFTIVELLIVIIVIGILATITVVAYASSQQRASDVRIRDAADKFSDAIQIWTARNGGVPPKGGWGSTVAANSTTGCADGAWGFQDYNYGSIDTNYKCTVGDALVASGDLSSALFTSLPASSVFNSTRMIFMIYPCSASVNSWIFMYNLRVPTATDTANINSALTACGYNPVTAPYIPTYGMRGAIIIKFS